MKKKVVKKQITLDTLAGMVAGGFSDMDRRFVKIEERLLSVEQGQEEIKLKLDNVAYRFEVQELQRRVALLERKAGISR
ncbi:MAG: hypothetical protein M1275_03515 [Patescibacteria group bacterium]|nr:hypothetical protein [Patescibacteria group bacterium]